MWLLACVFFFKQKTAYEMRISDWSSDVCSSDLGERATPGTAPAGAGQEAFDCGRPVRHRRPGRRAVHANRLRRTATRPGRLRRFPARARAAGRACVTAVERRAAPAIRSARFPRRRSEEHTSELQSLMRISYAVFCLKQKKHIHTQT